MGGSNCPETPRQKMVGMMYLFLTAMLAINVSDQVLDAFEIIDDGLKKTIETFTEKNKERHNDFAVASQENAKKVAKYYDAAKQISAKSDSLCQYIHYLKGKIVRVAEGPEFDMETQHITKKNNIDAAAQVLDLQKYGYKLKDSIIGYRELIGSIVNDSTFMHAVESLLDTSEPKKKSADAPHLNWVTVRFGHTPLVGALALLSKIQIDVKTAESDVLNYLYAQIDAGSFKFNKLVPKVIANESYVLKGDTYQANIFMAAMDTLQNPEIVVNGIGKVTQFKDNMGVMRIPANRVGPAKYSGYINYKMPSGVYQKFPFDFNYTVGEPSVTISATKMNVFYVGVDNPVSISAPGFTADQVMPSIDNGKLIKSGSNYIAKVTKPGKSVITVKVKMSDGSSRILNKMDFRVKMLPDPIAVVAGKKGGNISKAVLKSQAGVFAKMENFVFDLKYTVRSFTISSVSGGYTRDEKSKSWRFTPAQKKLLSGAKTGQKVYIEDIIARGPDGKDRALPTISFKIK